MHGFEPTAVCIKRCMQSILDNAQSDLVSVSKLNAVSLVMTFPPQQEAQGALSNTIGTDAVQ